MLYLTSTITILLVLLQGGPSLQALVDGVEKSLRGMKDFSADFEQIVTDPSNQMARWRGHLDLKRDGGKKMMRAEFKDPAKLYVSDGKLITEFIPEIGEARQEQVKKSENDFVPFMLLLGEKGVFDGFGKKEKIGEGILRLYPNDKKLPIVELEVDPKTFLVQRLVLTDTATKANTQFIFKEPKANQGVPLSVFEFNPPPGVKVIKVK